MLMRPALIAVLVLLTGCASFPEVEAAQQGRVAGVTPALVPMAGLLAQAGPGRANPNARDALDARAGGLRARAGGLRARAGAMRGPVHDAATRARLAAAIAAYPALMGGS
jgi:hypothetical protein